MPTQQANEMLVEKTKTYINTLFKDECPSHDYQHVLRVYNNAMKLQSAEGGDPFIIAMGALLHDVEDYKLAKKPSIRQWLEKNQLPESQIQIICQVVNSVSYSKNLNTVLETIEQKIVQDADRLDAIGAIGIARAFSYGGENNRTIYCPNHLKGRASDLNSSIEHFYGKLLQVADKLNTESAKTIAIKRQQLMKIYLENFYNEMAFSTDIQFEAFEKVI